MASSGSRVLPAVRRTAAQYAEASHTKAPQVSDGEDPWKGSRRSAASNTEGMGSGQTGRSGEHRVEFGGSNKTGSTYHASHYERLPGPAPGRSHGAKGSKPIAPPNKAGKPRPATIMGFQITETVALVLLNCIALLYGSNTAMMKTILLATNRRPSLATAARCSTAAVAVIPFILDKGTLNPKLMKAGAELGFWLGLGLICQAKSLLTATSSEASVMLALTLVVVSVLEVWFGRKVTVKRALPVAMAIIGLVLMELGSDAPAPARNTHFTVKSLLSMISISAGTSWGIGSSVWLGVHLFRSEMLQDKAMDSAKLGALQMVFCALLSLGWVIMDFTVASLFPSGKASLSHASFPLHLAELPWLEIAFCGIVATGLAQFLELICVKHAKASSTAIVFAQVPVVGMILGFLIHGDRLSVLALLGSLTVISASAVPHLLSAISGDVSGKKSPLPKTGLRKRVQQEIPKVTTTNRDFLGVVSPSKRQYLTHHRAREHPVSVDATNAFPPL